VPVGKSISSRLAAPRFASSFTSANWLEPPNAKSEKTAFASWVLMMSVKEEATLPPLTLLLLLLAPEWLLLLLLEEI